MKWEHQGGSIPQENYGISVSSGDSGFDSHLPFHISFVIKSF
jgi:hypothetical protein